MVQIQPRINYCCLVQPQYSFHFIILNQIASLILLASRSWLPDVEAEKGIERDKNENKIEHIESHYYCSII